jgi:hypothetical protein
MTELMAAASAAIIMASDIIVATRAASRIVKTCPYLDFPTLDFRVIAKITSDLNFIQSVVLADSLLKNCCCSIGYFP